MLLPYKPKYTLLRCRFAVILDLYACIMYLARRKEERGSSKEMFSEQVEKQLPETTRL